jgi:hypothetical protein
VARSRWWRSYCCEPQRRQNVAKRSSATRARDTDGLRRLIEAGDSVGDDPRCGAGDAATYSDETFTRSSPFGVSAHGDEAYVCSPDGILLAQHDSTSTQYVIHDRLGSTTGIDGSSVSRDYTYDPDGSADTTGSGAGTAASSSMGSTTSAPATTTRDSDGGRSDPLDHSADLSQANRYLFGGVDPANHIDLTGTDITFRERSAVRIRLQAVWPGPH